MCNDSDEVWFGIFCSIDPGNTRARHGMYRLEKRTDVGMDTTYDMDVDDASTSENEVGLQTFLNGLTLIFWLCFFQNKNHNYARVVQHYRNPYL